MYPDTTTTSDSDLDFVPSLSSNVKRRSYSTEWKYVCSFSDCGERFMRQVHLDRHEFKHYNVRKYVCTHEGCAKSYIVSTHLKRHIKVFHEKFRLERTIKCAVDSCSKLFDSLYNMEKHMRNIHENPKVYSCAICSQDFRRKMGLRAHIITHTGQYPLKCEKCSKGFVMQSMFDRHTCKMYKCEQCSKEFEKWSNLVAHKRQEHPNIQCNQCQKTFKRKTQLKLHQATHLDEKDREVLQCPREGCNRFYTTLGNLRNHIKVKHDGQRFKCPVEGCGRELTSKKRFILHAKQHDPNVQRKSKKKTDKPKKPRKDAGIKKKSTAVALSGVAVDLVVEKAILKGEGADIEIVHSEAEISVTDEEERVVPRIVELSAFK